MGAQQSGTPTTPPLTTLDLSESGLTAVPYKPEFEYLQQLIAPRNLIRDLPMSLHNLRGLDISFNFIRRLTPKLIQEIQSYDNLVYLDLSINFISDLKNLLDGMPALKRLYLFSNKISHINIRSDIEFLNLGHNLFTSVPELPNSLIKLNMDFNYIKTIDFCLPNLTKLSMSLNGIEYFREGIQFPLLKELDLSKNRLKKVPNLFYFCPKLEVLDLSDNLLEEFPLPPQTIVDYNLSANKFRTVPHILRYLTKLKKLDLSKNRIKRIPRLPPSICSLNLQGCEICQIEYCSVPKLTRLTIRENRFSHIPAFENCQLTEYYLAFNYLTKIERYEISHFATRIDFSYNYISEIPNNFFDKLDLKFFAIADNRLTSIPPSIKYTALTVLVISENKIKKLPKLPKTLISLFAGYCDLDSLPDSLSKNPNLRVVDVPGNNLQSIPTFKSVTRLHLSRNKFTVFPDNIPNTIVNLDLSFNDIVEIPEDLCFLHLDELDLSFNCIINFPENFNAPMLRYLRISANPLDDLNTSVFPHLLILDISMTNVKTPDDSPIKQILVSEDYPSSPNLRIHRLTCDDWVAYAEMKGVRDTMEDAIIVRSHIKGNLDVYAMIDGHGGSATAVFSEYFIEQYVSSESFKFTEKSVYQMIYKLDEALRNRKFFDGATIAIAFFNGEKLITAHIGDARILVIHRGGGIYYCTNDHKVTERSEFERIHSFGGRITNLRLHGVLAPSRCLGDLNVPANVPIPEVHTYKMKKNDRWLIIGCDGIFDAMTNIKVSRAARRSNDARGLAYDLRNLAFTNLSLDNISVIVIDLQARKLFDFGQCPIVSDTSDDETIPEYHMSKQFVPVDYLFYTKNKLMVMNEEEEEEEDEEEKLQNENESENEEMEIVSNNEDDVEVIGNRYEDYELDIVGDHYEMYEVNDANHNNNEEDFEIEII